MADDTAELESASTPEEVLAALRADMGRDGFQRDLDADHTVTFVARGPKLLVTFDTLENTLSVAENCLPVGLDFAEDKNWSLLHVAAKSDTWFRAPAIYEFIDELVDDMFFEDFDQTLFYGAGIGAYGACAYSVAAPGANVLAIAPQATLDTARAGWDSRFPGARRLRFDDRYGYAPDMLEGAAAGFVLFDPFTTLDHVHASLFQGPNVTRLACRHLNETIEVSLRDMDMLHQVIEAAGDGQLTTSMFYRLLRRRRDHSRYLRTVLTALVARDRPLHAAMLCRNVLNRGRGGPFFRKNLAAARADLARRNALPDWLINTETF